MFLSTRNYNYIYKFIVGASKISCENLVKKKLDLKIFELKKYPSPRFILFLIYIIINGKIFSKKRSILKYQNIEIGRFVVSQTYFSFSSYLNKYIFYKFLLKNFFKAGRIIESCQYYYNSSKIKGVYVDHCGYLNGVIYSYFVKKKIPVYTNNYPHGIFFVDNRKNKKKYLEKYEGAIRINIKKNLTERQKKKSINQISKLTKKKNYIPWLQQLKFKKINKINYKKFDYVIYTHSFTDGQMWYGYSGFENTLDWLEFTLDFFKNSNKQVLVKPHPNFYNSSLAIYSTWDRKIYRKIKKKYMNFNNLVFLDTPIQNYELQKKLDKSKCVAITKYGSVVMEAAFMNFKTICSNKTFFNSKFKIANQWSNIEEYKNLLNREYKKLKYPKKNDLIKLIYSLFNFYNSVFNTKNYYETIISKSLNLSGFEFYKLFYVKARTKISDSKLKLLNKLINKNLNKINLRVSKVVWNVKT